jgi:hypothetical protein
VNTHKHIRTLPHTGDGKVVQLRTLLTESDLNVVGLVDLFQSRSPAPSPRSLSPAPSADSFAQAANNAQGPGNLQGDQPFNSSNAKNEYER